MTVEQAVSVALEYLSLAHGDDAESMPGDLADARAVLEEFLQGDAKCASTSD